MIQNPVVGRPHFQQDGEPPHYETVVREFLNTRVPGQGIRI